MGIIEGSMQEITTLCQKIRSIDPKRNQQY